ncbi:DNA internalization-related competence protein ComEC/Rec2 [Candidatus Rhodobacter oscarellae]|uniref:DNA internalization-related competence protein ComEC/Rec2 n=1 Tax=Candidatus Rhodobacter oscarellae TaxID=1675527 RepID=A0A0J9E1A8_9RHOB|nr:ComEC/Rec2 family competence protein [Candidatus Rhodobacter lobularis]KMW56666.1 DNA internalization-related competence protein ComEC/Rec2 [Candidatus Rhodobacter lobularis]
MLARVLNAQRGHLFYWAPVLLAMGIGCYFALRFEPSLAHFGAIAGLAACLLLIAAVTPPETRPIPIGSALFLLGFLLAGARAHSVAEPVLGFRYYGPIEGRIVAVDRSHSDKLRLTLDQVRLDRVRPGRTPAKVRVSLHGERHFDPVPGLRVMMTGHLSPPQGPVEPGGFDFRLMAWFQGLGAVGYTRTPALIAAPAEQGAFELWVHRLRLRISLAVQDALPGRAGAFAAAVTTGDRSGMDRAVIEDLRSSNLSHLLAISGLHMGLLTGVVFAGFRLSLALVPRLALRLPVKKIAAVAALLAGAFYYLLSGGNVATERAFIMVSVMFAAILLDRRAITIRAVAIAALIVLLLRPETLISPGFQMSFAATTALVAVFGALREWNSHVLPKWSRPVLAVVLSSAVAGLATAPVAAAHFNRLADFGLLANVLSVPMMGLVVMPGAVLAAALAPLGLAWVGLAVMRPGIDWILGVAGWVANLEGAVTPVVTPSGWVLPILALGALWLVLWRGPARALGLAPITAAFVLWALADRPQVLVAESGGLVGVLTAQGRALSKPKGDGFTAEVWLENDGDAVAQETAFERYGFLGPKGDMRLELRGHRIALLSGRGLEARVAEACRSADVIVVAKRLEGPVPCDVYDQARLREVGALSVTFEAGALKLQGAKERAGVRPWSGAR